MAMRAGECHSDIGATHSGTVESYSKACVDGQYKYLVSIMSKANERLGHR